MRALVLREPQREILPFVFVISNLSSEARKGTLRGG